MPDGIRLSAHVTAIEMPDYGWWSYEFAADIGDSLELSIARAEFDPAMWVRHRGGGQGYTFNLERFGAKLSVAGDV